MTLKIKLQFNSIFGLVDSLHSSYSSSLHSIHLHTAGTLTDSRMTRQMMIMMMIHPANIIMCLFIRIIRKSSAVAGSGSKRRNSRYSKSQYKLKHNAFHEKSTTIKYVLIEKITKSDVDPNRRAPTFLWHSRVRSPQHTTFIEHIEPNDLECLAWWAIDSRGSWQSVCARECECECVLYYWISSIDFS